MMLFLNIHNVDYNMFDNIAQCGYQEFELVSNCLCDSNTDLNKIHLHIRSWNTNFDGLLLNLKYITFIYL